jgi:hypothetical protein
MRIEKDLTIDEIAERLAISRQTIFYWVRDVPLKKARRYTPGQRRRASSLGRASRCVSMTLTSLLRQFSTRSRLNTPSGSSCRSKAARARSETEMRW